MWNQPRRVQRLYAILTGLALLAAACAPVAMPAPTQPPAATATAAPADPTATPRPEPQTLRLYSSLPLTGHSAAEAGALVDAITLAVDQQTDGGLVCAGRFRIDYVSLDDASAASGQWAADRERANANQAAADPDAVVYLGTFNSDAARVSIPILNQAGLVMISPANTADDLTAGADAARYFPGGERNYARVIARDEFQGAFGARWAAHLGARTVYMLDDGQSYGRAIADQFEQSAAAHTLTVVGRAEVSGNLADLTAQITAANPDLIYYGGLAQPDLVQLIKGLRVAGVTAAVMGPDGLLIPDFAQAVTAASGDGIYTTLAGVVPAQLPAAGQRFVADYTTRYQAPSGYTAFAYEAASVALAAIARVCVKDRAAILKAVLATRDFQGVLGTWSFDANGDTTLYAMLGYRVQEGVWTEVPADFLPALP